MNHTDITPHIIPRRQWLVAYVQSCLEKKTAERLKAMGVEYYLPIQSEIRQWSDRRKKVDRLVIPMMIFVHVTPQERPLPLTLQAISRYMVLRGERAYRVRGGRCSSPHPVRPPVRRFPAQGRPG